MTNGVELCGRGFERVPHRDQAARSTRSQRFVMAPPVYPFSGHALGQITGRKGVLCEGRTRRALKLPAPKEEDLSKGILEAIDMDSYRAEKKATLAIALPDADADAEIEPVPTDGGGRKAEPVLDKLSNIIKSFNEQFAGFFNDPKAVERRITEVIPPKVLADEKYQNAKQNSDRENARIEHDRALQRVITAMFKDDAQLFKQFQYNESFRGWLTDTIFGLTYD